MSGFDSGLPGFGQADADWRYYSTYMEDTRDWREERYKLIKFAFGDQWSGSESGGLEDREQMDIMLNMIRPLLRTTVSLQLAGQPRGLIFGRNNIQSLAGILQKMLDYHMNISKWDYLTEKTVMRQNREGLGFYFVYVDPLADYGRGELRISHLSYNNVFVDRGAGKEWDWSDAPRFIVTELVRPERFYRDHPHIRVDESLNVDNDEITWSGMGFEKRNMEYGSPSSVENSFSMLQNDLIGKYIRPLDVYEKIVENVHIVRQRLTGKVLRIVTEDTPLQDEEKLFMVNSAEQLDPQFLDSLGLPPEFAEFYVLEEGEAPVNRIAFHRSVSGKMVVPGSQRILPISDYPVVPVVNEDTDNVEPRGEVDFQEGSQKLMNACISLVLYNASASSNKKTLVDTSKSGHNAGSFDELRRQFSMPNALIDMQQDQNGNFPVQELGPDSLNPAFFTLVQFFSQDLQFVSSVHSIRSGDPSNAPETFSALRTLGKWAEDTLRIRRSRHELAIERVMNLILEWAPFVYTFHKFFDITNEETDEVETIEINAPGYDSITRSFRIMNDITSMQANYKIKMGSTAESEDIVETQLLMQLAQNNPTLHKHIIKRMPSLRPSEKLEIMQDIDLVAQQQQQITQLTSILNEMKGAMARDQANIQALSRKVSLQNFENQLERAKPKEAA
jgi:hypothetical protein